MSVDQVSLDHMTWNPPHDALVKEHFASFQPVSNIFKLKSIFIVHLSFIYSGNMSLSKILMSLMAKEGGAELVTLTLVAFSLALWVA